MAVTTCFPMCLTQSGDLAVWFSSVLSFSRFETTNFHRNSTQSWDTPGHQSLTFMGRTFQAIHCIVSFSVSHHKLFKAIFSISCALMRVCSSFQTLFQAALVSDHAHNLSPATSPHVSKGVMIGFLFCSSECYSHFHWLQLRFVAIPHPHLCFRSRTSGSIFRRH